MEEKNKDEMYMRKALAEAQQAYEAGEIPIGAIIVCKDRIIARAHNLTETLCDVTAHAEMQAITMAANELGGKYLTCRPQARFPGVCPSRVASQGRMQRRHP